MKPRALNTIYDLIATNYQIISLDDGKFLHTFTPKTTNTQYQFIANGTPEIEEGERYNIGYSEDNYGTKTIDLSCLSKNSEVNPNISYLFASQFSAERSKTNKAKNNERVSHEESDGYYWGKKYARREYGLVISKGAFYGYLDEIAHPKVNCLTVNPDLEFINNEHSVAYLDEGLEEAMANLIKTAKKVTKVMYKSPLYSKRFSIKGITAISDKK